MVQWSDLHRGPSGGFFGPVRVAHPSVERREGLAVGTGDAELPLRLKPECGKAQGHHSETIIKPFSSSGSGRFKITTMQQCNKT